MRELAFAPDEEQHQAAIKFISEKHQQTSRTFASWN